MNYRRSVAFLNACLLSAALVATASAQNADWQRHNLDLAGSRFAETDQITPENAHQLTPRWLFQHGVIDGVSNQTTPVIVDGIMYVTDSRGSVYAVDAADGHLLWIYDVTELLGGARREGYIFRHRGVTYEDGVVYSAAGSFMFALDAKTGEGRIPDFPVTRSHPLASWPSAANSSIGRTYRKTVGEESLQRSPVASR